MLPLFTPQPPIPATGVSQTIIKQDQEKCETRGIYDQHNNFLYGGND